MWYYGKGNQVPGKRTEYFLLIPEPYFLKISSFAAFFLAFEKKLGWIGPGRPPLPGPFFHLVKPLKFVLCHHIFKMTCLVHIDESFVVMGRLFPVAS